MLTTPRAALSSRRSTPRRGRPCGQSYSRKDRTWVESCSELSGPSSGCRAAPPEPNKESAPEQAKAKKASAVSGDVVDSEGQPVAGATILLVHSRPFQGPVDPIRCGRQVRICVAAQRSAKQLCSRPAGGERGIRADEGSSVRDAKSYTETRQSHQNKRNGEGQRQQTDCSRESAIWHGRAAREFLFMGICRRNNA